MIYHYITMQRIMLTLSDDEYGTLRRISFERRMPMAKLIRDAVNSVYGTTDREIGPPGRKGRSEDR